jgi:hypothetical protein
VVAIARDPLLGLIRFRQDPIRLRVESRSIAEQGAADPVCAWIVAGASAVSQGRDVAAELRAVRPVVAATESVGVGRVLFVVRLVGRRGVTRCGVKSEIKKDPHSSGHATGFIGCGLVFLEFHLHLVAKKYGDLPESLQSDGLAFALP